VPSPWHSLVELTVKSIRNRGFSLTANHRSRRIELEAPRPDRTRNQYHHLAIFIQLNPTHANLQSLQQSLLIYNITVNIPGYQQPSIILGYFFCSLRYPLGFRCYYVVDVMCALVPQIFHLQAKWVATSVLMLRMHTNQLM
jgi:hypothetical protein